MTKELNDLGLKLLTRAMELEEKACDEEDGEDKLKYSYMSDGLMEGVHIIEDEIKKKKEEPKKEEEEKQLDKVVGRALGKYTIATLAELYNDIREMKNRAKMRKGRSTTDEMIIEVITIERIEDTIMKRINEIKRRYGI